MEKFELNEDIKVLCAQASSFPAGIQTAFQELEKKLPDLAQRQVFGISYGDGKGNIIYKAAASMLQDDEASQGFEPFTIKKGIYISELIQDFMKNIPQIGITFQRMLKHPALDTGSYCLEWYKGKDVLCLVKLDPIKEKQLTKTNTEN
jgi:hypothetical protein